jgi:hypothetical protein
MDLYESNYIRLRRLIPDIDALGDTAVSVSQGCMDLQYILLEQTPYTSSFILTYYFDDNSRFIAEPNLEIRIYHDARLAEVISAVIHKHHYCNQRVMAVDKLISPDLSILQSKWRLNRFLYKWLNFCLLRGHVFRPNVSLLQPVFQPEVLSGRGVRSR